MPENDVDTTPSPPHNENNLSDPILLPESPTIDPSPPTPFVDYPPSISTAPEANPTSPNIHLKDDVNTNALNSHVRHSKYPLRIQNDPSSLQRGHWITHVFDAVIAPRHSFCFKSSFTIL
ncbi:hypothetical protein GHT06_007585 [Daphnia sinensis]|uniref:Uncharacterized protein n=1 Tax=Daphnia sinensis TaxID=1820382 RepID=A0AAD5KU51_9CRUS|nr:hypothetical protein GHT06_007585 [Daphnia sinensis]